MPPQQKSSMGGQPGAGVGLISSGAIPPIPGLRHDAGQAGVGFSGAALPGFGMIGGDLGAELSYGPPPTGSSSDLGLGLSYGPPPVGAMGSHIQLGGCGGLWPGLGYGVPPPTMAPGASP